jgi:hypothetical protein
MNSLAEARRIVHHQYLIGHEACHASAAILLGLDLVDISTRPTNGAPGMCRISKVGARPRDLALVVLAALVTDPRLTVPRFPMYRLEDKSGDEQQLRELVEEMELDRAGWARLRRDALELVAREDFCLLEFTLKTALERWPVLDGELLAAIIAIGTAEHPRKEATCSI